MKISLLFSLALTALVFPAQGQKEIEGLKWTRFAGIGVMQAKGEYSVPGLSQRDIRDRVYEFVDKQGKEHRARLTRREYDDAQYHDIWVLDDDVKVKTNQMGFIFGSCKGNDQVDLFAFSVRMTCQDGMYQLHMDFNANDDTFLREGHDSDSDKKHLERFTANLATLLKTIDKVILQKPDDPSSETNAPTRKRLKN